MERVIRYILKSFSVLFLLLIVFDTTAIIDVYDGDIHKSENSCITPPDTNLPYPIPQNTGSPYQSNHQSGMYLHPPKNINSSYVYDPETNQYIFTNQVGSLEFRPTTYMSFEEFLMI